MEKNQTRRVGCPRNHSKEGCREDMRTQGSASPAEGRDQQKSSAWKQDDFEESSFTEWWWGLGCTRLRRIKRGGVELRGRRQVQSTCLENVTVREKRK